MMYWGFTVLLCQILSRPTRNYSMLLQIYLM